MSNITASLTNLQTKMSATLGNMKQATLSAQNAADSASAKTGDLALLPTANKTAIVAAITEIKGMIDNLNDTYGTDAEIAAQIQAVNDAWAAADSSLTGLINNKLDSSAFTAAAVLNLIRTVDGTDSGLDADLLDGKHASEFIGVNDQIDLGEIT